jgi:hypothetical protein
VTCEAGNNHHTAYVATPGCSRPDMSKGDPAISPTPRNGRHHRRVSALLPSGMAATVAVIVPHHTCQSGLLPLLPPLPPLPPPPPPPPLLPLLPLLLPLLPLLPLLLPLLPLLLPPLPLLLLHLDPLQDCSLAQEVQGVHEARPQAARARPRGVLRRILRRQPACVEHTRHHRCQESWQQWDIPSKARGAWLMGDVGRLQLCAMARAASWPA